MSHDETHSAIAKPPLNQKKSSTWLWSRKGVDPTKAIPSIYTSSVHGEASNYAKNTVPKPKPMSRVSSELEMDPESNTLTIHFSNGPEAGSQEITLRVQDEEGPEAITLCIHRMYTDNDSDKASRPRLLSIVSNESGTSVQELASCIEKILAREPLDFSSFINDSTNAQPVLENASSKELLNEKPENVPENALNPLATRLLQATEAVFHPFDHDTSSILNSPDSLKYPNTLKSPDSLNSPDTLKSLDPPGSIHHSSEPEPRTSADSGRGVSAPEPTDAADATQTPPDLETTHVPESLCDLTYTESSGRSQVVPDSNSNQESANTSMEPTVEEPDTNCPQKVGTLPKINTTQYTMPVDQASTESEPPSTMVKDRSLSGLANLPPPKIRIVRATDESCDEVPETASMRASIDTLPELKTSTDTSEATSAVETIPRDSTRVPMDIAEASNGSRAVPTDSTKVPANNTSIPTYATRTSISTTDANKTPSTSSNKAPPSTPPKSSKLARSTSYIQAGGGQIKQNDTGSESKAPTSTTGEVINTISPSNFPPTSRPMELMAETLGDVEVQVPQHAQKRKSLVRKTRRMVLRTPVLKILLGRQLAGQTKPILCMVADGVDLGADGGVDAEAGVAACLAAGLRSNAESNAGTGSSCRRCRQCPCKMPV